MKTSSISMHLCLLLFCCLCLADDSATNTLPELSSTATNAITKITLKDGTTYTNITVIQSEPDGLSITHRTGIAKVYFEEMVVSDESRILKEKYSYDPEKSKEYIQSRVLANALRRQRKLEMAAKEEELKQTKAQIEREKAERIRKIQNRIPFIGMRTWEAEEAFGRPQDINKTIGKWGVHEQWVFRSMYVDGTPAKSFYLYFEDYELTSWQY